MFIVAERVKIWYNMRIENERGKSLKELATEKQRRAPRLGRVGQLGRVGRVRRVGLLGRVGRVGQSSYLSYLSYSSYSSHLSHPSHAASATSAAASAILARGRLPRNRRSLPPPACPHAVSLARGAVRWQNRQILTADEIPRKWPSAVRR